MCEKSNSVILLKGSWNGMEKLNAWAKASLEGNLEEAMRLDQEIMSRGAKKPKFEIILGGKASRFDHLLEMIANGRFEEAEIEMANILRDQEH